MAGLGKYKKGAKFTLKSGNTPLFKHMGNSPSPITNEFGIGKGTSPYKHKSGQGTRHEHREDGKTVKHGPSGDVLDDAGWEAAGAEEREIGVEGMKTKYAGDSGDTEPKKGSKIGKILKKAGGTLLAGALGGLERVYGGKIADVPQVKFADKEEEVEEESIGEKVRKLTGEKSK